jgi:PhnB protein
MIEGSKILMLVPHLYLNGRCEEAISQYVKAFGAEVKVLIRHSEPDKKGVLHSEIYIHGQRIMLNDVNGKIDYKRGTQELVIIYNNEEDLKNSYEIMKEGSHTLSPMQAADYSPCVVEFWDKFGILWGFMVGET